MAVLLVDSVTVTSCAHHARPGGAEEFPGCCPIGQCPSVDQATTNEQFRGGTEMKYMLLLYAAEDAGPQPGSPEQAAQMQEWFAYSEALEKAGALISGEPLRGSETATTVRIRNGETVFTDGPFAETKEVLGGFYMIDVGDLDAALGWAAKIPLAPYGSVEVRPLLQLPPR